MMKGVVMRSWKDLLRQWTGLLFDREQEPFGEELDLLLLEERIAEQEHSSPTRKRASLIAGAKRLLEQGHSRYLVSIIYGNDAVRAAEGLLAPTEWTAVGSQITLLTTRAAEALKAEACAGSPR